MTLFAAHGGRLVYCKLSSQFMKNLMYSSLCVCLECTRSSVLLFFWKTMRHFSSLPTVLDWWPIFIFHLLPLLLRPLIDDSYHAFRASWSLLITMSFGSLLDRFSSILVLAMPLYQTLMVHVISLRNKFLVLLIQAFWGPHILLRHSRFTPVSFLAEGGSS